MKRRDFLRDFGLALAATWALSRLPWPHPAEASSPPLRLALLADAHLKSGDPSRPEAQALAQAVAEIRALAPAPDLVLFAGDLAHDRDPQALALGREILADLPAPLLLVGGEGDGPPEGSGAWQRLFGENRFAHKFRGANIIGLHTALGRSPSGPAFNLGEGQLRWLVAELRHLDPAAPLVILSHAPLRPIFRPWQQWTADAHHLTPLLAPFRRVLFLHGHVHQTGAGCQGSGVGGQGHREWPVVSGQWPESNFASNLIFPALFTTKNQKLKTKNLSIPATAWPLPSPLEGTPRCLRPGLGPRGCGWGLLACFQDAWDFRPQIWQA